MKNLLPSSPTCIVYGKEPSERTQNWLAKLRRHLIVIESKDCDAIVPSRFDVSLFCINDNQNVQENYLIRSKTVMQNLGVSDETLLYSSYKDRIPRRGDLQGIELSVTTLKFQQEIKDVEYGPHGVAKVGGLFGDLFMILCKI